MAATTAKKSLAMRNHAPQAQTTHRRVNGPGGGERETAEGQQKSPKERRHTQVPTNITQHKLYRSEEPELQAPPALVALRDA